MANTYCRLRAHLVWSTKQRSPWIDPAWRPRLLAFTGGIVEHRGGRLIAAGGTRDHVHLYVCYPVKLALSDLVSAIKANSTRWVRRTLPHSGAFCWQSGFAAFSVNPRDDRAVREYIRNQEAHHRERSFEDEYRMLLEAHAITFDPRYVLD